MSEEATEVVHPPRKTLIMLSELPGQAGGFSVGLALCSQDPEQQYGEDLPFSITDIVAMALVDIVKTTPKAFTDRIDAVQARLQSIVTAINDGADAETAGRALSAGDLVAPEAANDVPANA